MFSRIRINWIIANTVRFTRFLSKFALYESKRLCNEFHHYVPLMMNFLSNFRAFLLGQNSFVHTRSYRNQKYSTISKSRMFWTNRSRVMSMSGLCDHFQPGYDKIKRIMKSLIPYICFLSYVFFSVIKNATTKNLKIIYSCTNQIQNAFETRENQRGTSGRKVVYRKKNIENDTHHSKSQFNLIFPQNPNLTLSIIVHH